MLAKKTHSQKPAEVSRKWYVIDASSTTLGRLSTEIAKILVGKNKVDFTPHVDGGDYVVVINASKLKVTGGKEDKKIYYRHTGFPGGIKQRTLGEMLEKDPCEVVKHSVRGMIPANKLRDDRLARLKVFVGEEHAHTAQQPTEIKLKGSK